MMAPPWMRVSERRSQRSLRSLRMVCAETSKRRASSSTITRPEARAMLRISAWRWVNPVTGGNLTSEFAWCGGSTPRSTRERGKVNEQRDGAPPSPLHGGCDQLHQRVIIVSAGRGDGAGRDQIVVTE